MAENAISILIDVLASEGISSLNDLTKALSTAYESAGTLTGTVDELDGSLSTLAKSGMSADDMAFALTRALKDAGVVVGDTEAFVAKLSEALGKLGVSAEDASGAVNKASESNRALASSADGATAAVDRQGGALKATASEAELYAAAIESSRMRAMQATVAENAAIDNLGSGYARLETLSGLATPALMKAASWAGIGLAGLAYEGIKQYTQFQRLITQTITQAGEAPSKMGFLTNLAESVAKTTGQNLDDVANTIYRAASGTASWNNGLGATKAQLTGIVTQVSKLNVLGNINTGAESEQASRVVTALINANIRGIGKNPAAAAALVNAAVGSGDMRLGDLVPGIGRGVLQSAVANNVSAKDTLAWIADLTSTGTTASVAGNYVKTGINLLANPSAQGTDVLSMIGIKPGEIGRIMSGPGGLLSAAKTLKSAMNQLNPSSVAGYFFNTIGHVRAGGGGLAGAIDKLQTMSANSLSPKFISDFTKGTLTTQEKQQAFSLILDKAYGGSKQFATIASILNNPALFGNIEQHMTAEDNLSYLKRSEARAESTPSQQFKRMEQSLLVDLVGIGKALTPAALAFGHLITGVIGGLTKFKGVIYGFVTMALGLLGYAGLSKMAEIGKGISPYIGAGYNRLGLLAGKNSKFTTAMEAKANGGRFSFLDIYKTKKRGILGKIGGEAISAGYLPGSPEALAAEAGKISPGEGVLNSSINKGNVLLEEIARNTGALATENGGPGGIGGGARAAEREVAGGGAQYAPQFKDPVTGRFLSAAESVPLAERMAQEESAAQTAAMYYGATGRGRGVKSFRTGMNGGAAAAAENVESTYASRGASSMNSLEESASNIATRGATADASLAANGLADVLPEASGMLSGLGESLGGIMGGPIGMVGMMLAPALISGLTPAFGKLAGLLGGWLSGGKVAPYHPNIHNALDTTQAHAKVQKALKVLRQYQTETKSKSGKITWALNNDAYLADPNGYNKALATYKKANKTYTGSWKNANAITTQALDATYGKQGSSLGKALKESEYLAKHSEIGVFAGEAASFGQFSSIEKTLPLAVQQSINNRLKKYGRDNIATAFQDMAIAIKAEKTRNAKVLSDAAGYSVQAGGHLFPTFEALALGGYQTTASALTLNSSQMRKFLREKHTTAADAANVLPAYAHQYHSLMLEDTKALATKNLPPAAKAFFENQKNQAEQDLKGTESLIREMREAAKNTHIADDSLTKLAKENATQLSNSSLPTAIAKALGPVLAQYIKLPKPTGTSSASTRTQSPSPVPTGKS